MLNAQLVERAVFDTSYWGRCFFLILFLCCGTLSFSQDISSDSADIAAGESLFEANCKSCHRVKKKLIGPALAGVYDRAPSMDWIKSFVRNSSKMIASGDEYANQVYEENNKLLMTSFTSFTDEQIMSIMAYVKAEAEKPDEIPVAAAAGTSEDTDIFPVAYLYPVLIGAFTMLLLLLIVLVLITNALKRYLQHQDLEEAEREVVESPYFLPNVVKSPGFVFVVAFIVVAVSLKTIVDGLYSIGVQRGYAPKQPIAFSHKVHAGQYKVDCQYCHTGVMKGRSANIPSPNVCMNCHSQIRKGTNTGEAEIAKVVAAFETEKPIEWVRVHNLPDLAYFNHSQHVNVAGLNCQDCHGTVEEMDVVQQQATLTMGWCVDCHRKTAVNTKGNKYYDQLLEMHKSKDVKVEDIGGLECAKCHY